ncbi:MAG: DUF4129 domain-containing protein [Thermomicrobiales bacterium]|nr:DUF4129 domain-containing protein [Thermomicrobiales bacterium]
MESSASPTIHREIAVVVLAIAEAFIVHLVLITLLGPGGYPLWLMIVIVAAAHVISRFLAYAPLHSSARQALGLAAVLILILVGMWLATMPDGTLSSGAWLVAVVRGLAFDSAELSSAQLWVTFLLVIYAWWRSPRRIRLVIYNAQRMLRIGILMCLGMLPLLALRAAWPSLESRTVLEIAGFIGFTLAGMSGLRTGQSIAEAISVFTLRWALSMLLPITGIVAIALVLTGLLDERGLDAISTLAGPPATVLVSILDITARIIGAVLSFVLAPVFWLGNWLFDLLRSSSSSTGQPATPDSPPAQREVGELPDLPDSVRYSGALIVLLVIVIVALRRAFHRPAQSSQLVSEERSSIFNWRYVLPTRSAEHDPALPLLSDPLSHLREDPRLRHTLRIRESYRTFQRWGAEHGRRRRRNETAEQYLAAMHAHLTTGAGASQSIDVLTDVYRHARYSGVPATDAEAKIAESATQAIDEQAQDIEQ